MSLYPKEKKSFNRGNFRTDRLVFRIVASNHIPQTDAYEVRVHIILVLSVSKEVSIQYRFAF